MTKRKKKFTIKTTATAKFTRPIKKTYKAKAKFTRKTSLTLIGTCQILVPFKKEYTLYLVKENRER